MGHVRPGGQPWRLTPAQKCAIVEECELRYRIKARQADFTFEAIGNRFHRSRNWAWHRLHRTPKNGNGYRLRWELRYKRRIDELAKRYTLDAIADRYDTTDSTIAQHELHIWANPWKAQRGLPNL